MKRAVFICPGRGSYTKSELGSLARYFPRSDLLATFDAQRDARGQQTLSALDGAQRYASARHGISENASALIYAASLGDFIAAQEAEEIEIVAVTGNSLGWYTTLACGGALTPEAGFELVNTMGTLMQRHPVGGQTILPITGANWQPDPAREAEVLGLVDEINGRVGAVLSVSIRLGGYLVVAGNEAGLTALEGSVPREDPYPMRLPHHAAFHSPLLADVAAMAARELPEEMFTNPRLPMIDGRGAIWWPGASTPRELKRYTLGHQITQTYDFTRTLGVAAREFAPDMFILAGPGASMGGAVAQVLIGLGWQGLCAKADFQARQTSSAPLLAAMGRLEQRGWVVG